MQGRNGFASCLSQGAQGPVGVFHPLFQTAFVRVLGSRHRRTSPTTGERKHKGRDRHADCCENRCDSNSLLTKQCTYALSQCGVFMEEPPECLTDSVDLGPEGSSVRGGGFEPCLSSSSMSESALSSFLIRSRISLFISVSSVSVRFLSTSDFRSSILVSFARLFANSSLVPVIAFSSPASSLLAWVTHTVSIGLSSIVFRVLSTCSAL